LISYLISIQNHDIIHDITVSAFLELPWYHKICMIWHMISHVFHDIIHDIKNAIVSTFLARTIMDITHDNVVEIMGKGYDIKNFWYWWYFIYGFAYDMAWYVPMISRTSNIIALWYHLLLRYHVTCTVSWCWLGAPPARSSSSSSLAAANELGTGI
jgi:hypothetical protein